MKHNLSRHLTRGCLLGLAAGVVFLTSAAPIIDGAWAQQDMSRPAAEQSSQLVTDQFRTALSEAKNNLCDSYRYTNNWTRMFNAMAQVYKQVQSQPTPQNKQLLAQMTSDMETLRQMHKDRCDLEKFEVLTVAEITDEEEQLNLETSAVIVDEEEGVEITSVSIIHDDEKINDRLGFTELLGGVLLLEKIETFWAETDTFTEIGKSCNIVAETPLHRPLTETTRTTVTRPTEDLTRQVGDRTAQQETVPQEKTSMSEGQQGDSRTTAREQGASDETAQRDNIATEETADHQREQLEESTSAMSPECQADIDRYKASLRAMGSHQWKPAKPPKGKWTVMVHYTLNRTGNVSNVMVSKSSGHPPLDESAVSQVKRLSNFPPMPTCYQADSMEIDHAFTVIRK